MMRKKAVREKKVRKEREKTEGDVAGKRRIRRKSLLNNGFRGGEGERYPQLERTGTERERKRERERERERDE
jgi:hypothetical protein